MGFRKIYEHRFEQRLRHIEQQLDHIFTLLEAEFPQASWRDVLKDYESEQAQIRLSFVEQKAANDTD